jgi:hypothetical protein
MVTLPAENEERIVRYLLDEMGEEERLQLEDRLFHESEFFELVQSVEDELILKFVRGDLESEPASRFNEVYMNAPAKRARVESARAWRQAAGEMAAASRFSPAAKFWIGVPAVAAAAAILIALLLPLQRKHSVQQFVPASEKISVATFALAPGLTRSGGGVEIKVPRGTDVIQLELALPYPAGQTETYHAVLGSPERPGIWEGAASRNDTTVVIRVPAKMLLAGDYSVELLADGKDTAMYAFRVAK